MATNYVTPAAANDNTRDFPVSFAQARHDASLPTYLRGGRI